MVSMEGRLAYFIAIILLLTGLPMIFLFSIAIVITSAWLFYSVSDDYLVFIPLTNDYASHIFINLLDIFDIYLIFCTFSVLTSSIFVYFTGIYAHTLIISESHESNSGLHESISESHESISESYENISKSHESIFESYESISESHEGISESYESISKSYENISKSHDSISEAHEGIS